MVRCKRGFPFILILSGFTLPMWILVVLVLSRLFQFFPVLGGFYSCLPVVLTYNLKPATACRCNSLLQTSSPAALCSPWFVFLPIFTKDFFQGYYLPSYSKNCVRFRCYNTFLISFPLFFHPEWFCSSDLTILTPSVMEGEPRQRKPSLELLNHFFSCVFVCVLKVKLHSPDFFAVWWGHTYLTL